MIKFSYRAVPTAVLTIALAVLSTFAMIGFSDAAVASAPDTPIAFASEFDAAFTPAPKIASSPVAENIAPAPVSLGDLVAIHTSRQITSQEGICLASAIYFEARGESLIGQLAVAEVVLNRAEHRGWRSTICAVVTQPRQFSFVRNGRIPAAPRNTRAWRRAVAISFIARESLWETPASQSLYFHADYVYPRWRTAVRRQAQLGTHIFYR